MDSSNKIWAFFLSLGCNMWADKWDPPHDHPIQCDTESRYYEITSTEKDTWKRIVDELPSFGINMVVIDLGEGVRYDSHPELANEGSWTKEELMAELARMRLMGLEPIPKLNFSTCHDAWLGEYAYMVSTKKYYEVVSDIIADVCEMFGNPRFFHLGMDEEDFPFHHTGITTIRSDDLWWHDLYFLFDEVQKHGARPWIWSDYYWKHQDNWEKKMPKICVQSSWRYERIIPKNAEGKYPQLGYQTYIDFAKMGYDQIPIGTDWWYQENIAETMWLLLTENVWDEHMLGFMAVPWMRTWDLNYYSILNNAHRLKYAKRLFEEYTPEKMEEIALRESTHYEW